MQRPCGWLMVIFLVGCQAQSSAPPSSGKATLDLPVIAEALKLMDEGQLDQGLELLSAAIEKHPHDGRLYGARATLRHRSGLLTQALADLDRAVQASPEDAQLLNNRGFIRLALQQFDGAVEDLDHALKLKPDLTSACNNRGLVSLARGKHRDAIDWFNRALSLEADYVDALNNRGFAWMQLGRLESAYADLNQALRVNPKYVNALHNRGLLKARAGELEAAVLDFTEAMITDPGNPKYYEHRGGVYALLNKTRESHADQRMVDWVVRLQELNRAVAIQPRSAGAWSERAAHYFHHGDLARARNDARQALTWNPAHGPALVLEGRIALADRRYEDALKFADAAIETDEALSGWSIRGDACLALGRDDEALECFTAAKRFDASVAEIHYRKSLSLTAQGQTAAAEAQLELARELDPDIENRLR